MAIQTLIGELGPAPGRYRAGMADSTLAMWRRGKTSTAAEPGRSRGPSGRRAFVFRVKDPAPVNPVLRVRFGTEAGSGRAGQTALALAVSIVLLGAASLVLAAGLGLFDAKPATMEHGGDLLPLAAPALDLRIASAVARIHDAEPPPEAAHRNSGLIATSPVAPAARVPAISPPPVRPRPRAAASAPATRLAVPAIDDNPY